MNADGLIASLAAELRPVRRLRQPGLRALLWFGAVLLFGVLVAPLADLGATRARLRTEPDLAWAALGSVLTCAGAAFAAFQASVPGRSRAWALLPAAPASLWLGASSWGCLRGWASPEVAPADMHDALGCAVFIALVSVPLSALLLLMLRRACPLQPGQVAALAGLAAAAGAASLLTLFHPHDASAIDLLMHVAAVLAVTMLIRWAGRERLALR